MITFSTVDKEGVGATANIFIFDIIACRQN